MKLGNECEHLKGMQLLPGMLQWPTAAIYGPKLEI